MRDEQIERLLGGYATNTLTEAERRGLFEAALEDQDLFNALQDEEALRDLLADTASRSQVERALRRPEAEVRGRGWFARPWVWGLAGSLAAACLTIAVLTTVKPEGKKAAVLVAVKQTTAAPEAPAPTRIPEPERAAPSAAPKRRVQAGRREVAADREQARVAEPDTQRAATPVPSPAPPAGPADKQAKTETAAAAPSPVPAQPQKPGLVSQRSNMAVPPVPTQTMASSGFAAPATAPVGAPGAVPGKESTKLAMARGSLGGAMAKRKAADADASSTPVAVVALRRGTRLGVEDPIQNADAIRLAVRPGVSGSLTLFQGDQVLAGPMAVLADREYVLPETAVIVNGPVLLRITNGGGEAEFAVIPGQPLRRTK